MGEEEWERTWEQRRLLAYGKFGLCLWWQLTNDQQDEAVRREARQAGAGEAYARDCLRGAT